MAKILVIDDEEEVLLFVTGTLEKEHDITTASTWLEASDQILKQPFDLVLLDINLPGLQGDKLAEILNKNKKFSQQPLNFVIFSGLDEEELQQKAKKIGAKGYIHKPCRKELFTLRIHRFL